MSVSDLEQSESVYLRTQVIQLGELLKLFMKANGYGSKDKLRATIESAISQIQDTQESFMKVVRESDQVERLKIRNTELERFVLKQDELNLALKQQIADL